MNPDRPQGSMNTPEHLAVARKVAGEGIVLLKNERSFLPLDPDKKMTIAVIGENALRKMTPGGGSSELKARDEVSPLRGIQERFTNAEIIHSRGYASGPPQYGAVIPSDEDADSLKKAAIEVARKSDVVLYFGGLNKNWRQDCEGDDRKSMALPFGQDQLIHHLSRANKNIAVFLLSGNAVEMPWLSRVKSLVQTWYLGSEAGHAIADVVSGDVNPSGKLPFSFPVKLEDNGAHSFGEQSYPGDGESQTYMEDILVGYRWHDTKDIKPLFAFGYGLSYTRFKLSKIKTDKKTYAAGEQIIVSCTLANTGRSNGSEVIQVYVGKPGSQVQRALKELKAFKKVNLDAKARDEVQLALTVDDLVFYDENLSDWRLETGEYLIYVGTASDDISKALTISIKG
jgi:beta-glucosidase